MELRDRLEEMIPSELRIKDVTKFWVSMYKLIDQILAFEKEVIRNFIIDPTYATMHINYYIDNLKRELNKLVDGIYEVKR